MRTKAKTPVEEFIGTNLLNKLGIAILVIGVGFGAKYAIEHQLINVTIRIILGYVCGIVLIMIALRLKKKQQYENFSAVLLSGGIAILYFMTFAAYDFYSLIPRSLAFSMMLALTACTIYASINYNRQVVAIIGLVGASAVPFLLSDNSGSVEVLFTYMTILNAGILILSFKRSWRLLNHLAFILTWIIFSGWHVFEYNTADHFWISLIFASLFFVIFYISFLAFKISKSNSLDKMDISFTLLNSFVFYGLSYTTVNSLKHGEQYLGLLTVFIALLHFMACVIVYRRQPQSKDILNFVAGLVLIFLTLAVPVQFEGSWVTALWATEAVLLCWIGRVKKFTVYESISYPLLLLAFVSLVHDWNSFYAYHSASKINFLFNIQFFTSLWVVASIATVLWLISNRKYSISRDEKNEWQHSMPTVLSMLLLAAIYFSIYLEIANYWQQRYWVSGEELPSYNAFILKFKGLWLMNYSALFAFILGLMNIRYF